MFRTFCLSAHLRARFSFSIVLLLVIGVCLQGASAIWFATTAAAKTPGSTYCFYRKCHRVKTIAETQRLVGKTVSLHSSHYDSCHRDRYNPCGLTSSGEPFFADRADNAASPIYPDGTKLLVWSAHSQQAAVIRINNAGPYWGNRKLDVSRALARKLGFEKQGVAKLQVRILSAPTKREARYKRNRRYDKVQGPIGKFASLEEAEKGLAVLLAFEAMTTAFVGSAGSAHITSVDKPFEIAALATGGRAFADVPPEMHGWPVVRTQVAGLAWPVVEDEAARASEAPVQVASLEPSTSVRQQDRMAWPVVNVPPSRQRTRPEEHIAKDTLKVALAWPVVSPVVLQTSSEKPSAAGAELKVAAKTRAFAPQTASRKTTSRKLAKAKSKRLKRRKLARAKQRRAKARRARNAKLAKARTKKAKARVARRILPIAKPKPRRPYVATRQILHRALGRGA